MSVQDYLEPAVKDYADQAKAAYSAPINTGTFTGRQFVAGEDPLQTQAINIARQGVGSYQPFLSAAQTAQQQAAGTVGGLSALTGPQSYQSFMSPYQTQVIDATLAEYDKQGRAGEQAIKDAAVASGNFGGGREGAQLGQFQSDRLADRAALQAQLLQGGFTQANQLANQAFGQGAQLAGLQSGLANQQLGLAQTVPGLQAQATGMGQQLAGQDFGFRQAQADAAREQNRLQQFESIDRLARLGQGITGLTPGAGTVTTQSGVPAASPSPIGNALTAGIGAFGLGKLFGLG